MKRDTMTLLDGTILKVGDKVRARGDGTHWRVCFVLDFIQGSGVERAVLTGPAPFGTRIRGRYEIEPYTREARGKGSKA